MCIENLPYKYDPTTRTKTYLDVTYNEATGE